MFLEKASRKSSLKNQAEQEIPSKKAQKAEEENQQGAMHE